MPHKLRKSQLIDYDNAAAGHDGVLADKSGSILVKPCKKAEGDFYQAALDHPELKYYMPEYMGLLNFNQEATDAAAAGQPMPAAVTAVLGQAGPVVAVPSAEDWKPSGGAAITADTGLVMENVAHGFKKPNIIDVKLGARLWDDDSPVEKRQKLDKVADETTSRPLGFRIAGMKTYAGKSAEPIHQDTKGYKKYDKHYGRRFTVDDVHTGFREFFFVEEAGVTEKLGKRIIKRFLLDLEGLREVLEKEETRMYSASLLLVYEGDGEELEKKFAVEKEMMAAGVGSDQKSTDETAGTGQDVVAEPQSHTEAAEGDIEVDDSESDDASKLPKIMAVKIIDFAHAKFAPGQGPDENMLHGIRSLIHILDGLIN